jgi:hypothetical protein
MREAFKDCMTVIDSETFDIGRIILFIGIISFIGFTIIDAFSSWNFDMQSYGIGFGSLCGGAGALLKLKERSEPTKGD